MELALRAVEEDRRILTDPPAAVRLTEYGDNSVNFELRVWIVDPTDGLGISGARFTSGFGNYSRKTASSFRIHSVMFISRSCRRWRYARSGWETDFGSGRSPSGQWTGSAKRNGPDRRSAAGKKIIKSFMEADRLPWTSLL